MSYEKLIRIPTDRIGALIGKSGNTKKLIEKKCSVNLDIDSQGGEVLITTKTLAESFEPLEKQLEDLLDELNSTLRPRIEKPIRKRPLVAIGIAASLGVLLGIFMAGGRKS